MPAVHLRAYTYRIRSTGGRVKKLLVLLILVAIGVAVARKVREV